MSPASLNRFSLMDTTKRITSLPRSMFANTKTSSTATIILDPQELPKVNTFEYFETAAAYSRSNSLDGITSNSDTSPRASMLTSSRRTITISSTCLGKLTKEGKALERSMQDRDYVLVALELLNEVQSEFKLRLAWALVDLRKIDEVKDAKKRKVLLAQMNANFLLHGSPLEVDGLPPNLLVLGEDNCEMMLTFLVNELAKLPEIRDTLEPHLCEDSMQSLSELSSSFAEDFEHLAEVIRNTEQKRKLLRELMTSSLSSGLLVKIRFVAAIDQYEACVDRTEKKDLEKMIRKIFMTKGTMFYLDTVRSGTKLETARENVLKELSANSEVNAVLEML